MSKFEYRNGIYEGEAIDNIPNGKGKLVSGKDCFYEGEFLNGSFHGNGKFFCDGFGCFEGKWVNRSFVEGKAGYYSVCGGCETNAIYEGRFKDFLLVGNGKITRSNGEIYEGELLNGRPHGKGKLTHSDGTVIVGTWTDGQKDYEYTDEDNKNAGGDAVFGNHINYYEL